MHSSARAMRCERLAGPVARDEEHRSYLNRRRRNRANSVLNFGTCIYAAELMIYGR